MLIADTAIRYENDLAQQPWLFRQVHGHFECRRHDRSATGRQVLDEGSSLIEVGRISRHGFSKERPAAGTEADQVEAVILLRNCRPSSNAAFACTREVPSIDPEVSMMNTTSRG